MNEAHIFKIAGELKVQPRQVAATAKLFAEGATVPFIARYRKEATGSLDEVAITSIRERLLGLVDLDQRRDFDESGTGVRGLAEPWIEVRYERRAHSCFGSNPESRRHSLLRRTGERLKVRRGAEPAARLDEGGVGIEQFEVRSGRSRAPVGALERLAVACAEDDAVCTRAGEAARKVNPGVFHLPADIRFKEVVAEPGDEAGADSAGGRGPGQCEGVPADA